MSRACCGSATGCLMAERAGVAFAAMWAALCCSTVVHKYGAVRQEGEAAEVDVPAAAASGRFLRRGRRPSGGLLAVPGLYGWRCKGARGGEGDGRSPVDTARACGCGGGFMGWRGPQTTVDFNFNFTHHVCFTLIPGLSWPTPKEAS